MTIGYLLEHIHAFEDGHECVKLIGVFSSEALAQVAQQQVADQPGFRDLPEGFCISQHQVDGPIGWSEGYTTIQSGEE